MLGDNKSDLLDKEREKILLDFCSLEDIFLYLYFIYFFFL